MNVEFALKFAICLATAANTPILQTSSVGRRVRAGVEKYSQGARAHEGEL